MKKQITKFAVLAVATVIGVAPLSGQDTRERERELEARMRELRQELRQLEQELGRDRWSNFAISMGDGPRVLSLSSNRAQLGVLVQTNSDREIDAVGALLESVTPGSPADEAGLVAGDIVTAFDGVDLTGPNPDARPDESGPAAKLISLVRDKEPGDEVSITYERDGTSHTTSTTLRQMDGMNNFAFSTLGRGDGVFDVNVAPRVSVREMPRIDVNVPDVFVTSFFSGVWSDIELVSLNEDLGQYFGTDEGLLVIQAPGSDGIDLRGGDVILSIDGRSASTPSRAMRILRSYESGEELTMQIMRNRQRITVEMTVPENDGRRLRRERREYR